MVYPSAGVGNIIIGGKWSNVPGVRLRAAHSSPVGAIRIYRITQNPPDKPMGYANGTGGLFKYELKADAGGVPGAILAGGVYIADPEYPEWLNRGGFPLIGFPTFPVLSKGSLYHFTITNVDADPITNYSSINFLECQPGKTNPDPNHVVELSAQGVPWRLETQRIASPFGVFYADGNKQGNGGYQLSADKLSTLAGDAYGFGGL